MHEHPYAARAAAVLAVLSVLACFAGLARVVQLGFGHAPALSGFMYWNAVPMLAAAVSTLATFDSRATVMWFAAIIAPLLLIAGASSMAVMFFAADVIRQMSGPGIGVTHAPAIIFGSRLFVEVLAAIAMAYAGRWLLSKWRSG